MPGRRRTSRFLLVTPVDAVLVLQHPVTVDRLSGQEMWITSDFAATQNDLFSFSRIGSNPMSNLRMRVAASEPVVVGGAVRHRVRLTSATHDGPVTAAVVGMLTKTVRVRLIEVGQAGCLLECPCRLDEGVGGVLHVEIEGERWSDQLRVRRCERREGESENVNAYLAGAEFIWARPFQDASLRDVVTNPTNEKAGTIDPSQHKTDMVH